MMSPLLKAVGVGLLTLVMSVLILYAVSRLLHRRFLPPFPRLPAATPAPAPIVFPLP